MSNGVGVAFTVDYFIFISQVLINYYYLIKLL